MKRVCFLILIVGLTTMNVFGGKKEIRPVTAFTEIDASGVFDITVTKGDAESLVIEADDEVMPYVLSEVRNGVLYLYLDTHKKIKNVKLLKASIVMKDLEKVTLSGACKLTTNNLFTSNKFRADCNGASNMTIHINTGQLSIETSGACNIRIKANVTGYTYLSLSGASHIMGELNANDVKFNCSGVGSIELTGSANNIDMDASGASKILTEQFAVKNASIVLSGTGKITVNASDYLKVNSSGASSVNYKGSPVTEINRSDIATVSKI